MTIVIITTNWLEYDSRVVNYNLLFCPLKSGLLIKVLLLHRNENEKTGGRLHFKNLKIFLLGASA